MCISFKGSLIESSFAQKYNFGSKTYQKINTSFVELSTNSPNDKATINAVANSWEDGVGFATCIKNRFNVEYDCQKQRSKFYAITEQKDNFNNLNPSLILGIAEVSPQSAENVYIDYIAVSPDKLGKKPNSIYKKIGTSILNSIKKIYNQQNLFLETTSEALKFYIKNGFKQVQNPNLLLYKAK